MKSDFQFGEEKTSDHAPNRNSEVRKIFCGKDDGISVLCVVCEGNKCLDRNIHQVIENMRLELNVRMEVDIVHLRLKAE